MHPPGDLPTKHAESLSGSVVAGRYEVQELLGRGGTCEVYRAQDTLLRTKVALKRVRPDYARQSEYRERLIKEARRGRIADPRIAAVYDVVDAGDELMIVMEFVEGMSLRAHLAARLPMPSFWKIATECAEALRAAHDAGLVHRDIKPDNIMVTPDGGIKILDFGLAHRMAGLRIDPEMSTASLLVPAGTPRYMAPEAYRGGELDARTDIFALGVVFYEMLCGTPPFQAQSWSELNDEILHHDPPAPCKRRNVSGRLSRLVMQMIEKDPARRIASCEELLRALEHARRGDWPVRKLRNALVALMMVPLVVFSPQMVRSAREWLTPPLPRPTVTAVLPFEHVDGDEDEMVTARGLTELLVEALELQRDPRGFSVVRIGAEHAETVDTVRETREELGASLAITGELTETGRGLRAALSLIRTSPGEPRLRSRDFVTESGEFREVTGSILEDVHELLGKEWSGEPTWARVHARHSEGAFRLYLRGIGWLHSPELEDHLDRAIHALDVASRVDSEYAAVHAALATALNSRAAPGDLERAEVHCQRALELDPRLPAAWSARAGIQNARGAHSEAIESYRRIISLPEATPDAWLRLSQLEHDHGDPRSAAPVLDLAIEDWTGWWQPYWWRGSHRFLEGDYSGALDDYRRMVELAPEFYNAWAMYGGLLVLNGQGDLAVDALERSLELRRNRTAFSNLGAYFYNARRFEDAIRTYQDALQDEFDEYAMWMNLGDAFDALDSTDIRSRPRYLQAIPRAEAMLRAEPGDLDVIADLTQLYARVDSVDAAQRMMKEALDRGPDHPYVLYCCALGSWELGDRDRALELLEHAIDAGFPPDWVRDSPVFDEWRTDPRFVVLTEEKMS